MVNRLKCRFVSQLWPSPSLRQCTVIGVGIIVLFVVPHFGFAEGVDFDHEVLPLLTKAGCNAGACHGAATGRGGFELSLYGQRPEDDYHSIVTQLRGRRVNVQDPESSLLIRKGAEFIAHEGGQRIDPNSSDYQLIVGWIQSGAPRNESRAKRFAEIEVRPSQVVIEEGLGAETQVFVFGKFDGGEDYLLNSLAAFIPMDSDAIEVLKDGRVRVHRYGRHAILVRVRDKVAIAEIVVPWPNDPSLLPSSLGTSPQGAVSQGENRHVEVRGTPRHRIDELIGEQHKVLGISPISRAEERVLFRRLTLDLTGRIPTPEQWSTYQGLPEADRYEIWIDRLLASDEASEFWGYFLARNLEVARLAELGQREAAERYRKTLHTAAKQSIPLPDLLAELVLAEEGTRSFLADGFYRLGRDGREQAELFARQFLGVRLQCANCHDHPLDRWTQDDYHGLAALFSGFQRGQGIQFRKGSRYIHPRDGQVVAGKIPDGPTLAFDIDPRSELAHWVREDGRRMVLRSWVNRVWSHLLGRGLVEPIDDMRATNPPNHAALLDHLTDFWDSVDGDWRALVRQIVTSDAYQRRAWVDRLEASSEVVLVARQNEIDEKVAETLLIGRSVRRLPTEVLLDAWNDLLMRRQEDSMPQERQRAILSVENSKEMGEATRQVDRCDSGILECVPELEDTLRGRLAMMTGDLINRRLGEPGGILQRLEEQYPGDLASIVRQALRLAWAYDASEREIAFWVEQIEAEKDTSATLRDFYWSLVTSENLIHVR